MSRRRRGTSDVGARITVVWGAEHKPHTIVLTPRNWRRVKSGQPLDIRGKGYVYDGDFFWDYWRFGGGLEGTLVVDYGEDGGQGFVGNLHDAKIEERPRRPSTGAR
jgi:hypothetical protein